MDKIRVLELGDATVWFVGEVIPKGVGDAVLVVVDEVARVNDAASPAPF